MELGDPIIPFFLQFKEMIEQISKILSFRIPLMRRKRVDMKIVHFHRDFGAIHRRNNLSDLALSYKL